MEVVVVDVVVGVDTDEPEPPDDETRTPVVVSPGRHTRQLGQLIEQVASSSCAGLRR
jgi:hypothetical protein